MPRSDNNHPPPAALRPWHWFVLSAAAPLVHCASRLSLDLWHDEVYTVDYFVSRGPAFIVTDYSAPNNHLLFSLVLWPFYLLSDSNFVLRLPSFLCTVGTLAMVFMLARRFGGLTCAVLSTSLLGLNQMFLIHTIQIRGYGLSMFLTAWLVLLALSEEGDFRWRRFFAVTFVGAALLYVMPTNLLFFAPLAATALGLAVARRSSIGRVAAETSAWAAAALLALACYLPIAKQVMSAAESSSPSSWSYLPVIAGNFFRPAMHDYGWFAPLLLAALIALALPRRGAEGIRWLLPVAGLSVVVGAFMITGLLRISPFERNYCPLLVLLALLAGWLLAALAQSIRVRFASRYSSGTAAGVALAVVSLILWPQLWTYPQRLEARREQVDPADQWIADGYYCYYAANYRPSAVVRYLLALNVERFPYRVCCTDADALNLWYYFARSRLLLFDGYKYGPPKGGVAVFAVVPEPPPWRRLARDCRLLSDQIRTLRLLDDFGYYRLYQSSAPLDVGWPPDADAASQRPSAATK